MTLRTLLSRFDEAPALRRAVQEIETIGHTRLAAVIAAARPPVVAYLRQRLGGPLVVITGHPHRAQHLIDELRPWLDQLVELFPAFETLPYERAPLDKETLARRQALVDRLRHADITVVAPVRALLQPVSAPPIAAHTLRVGDEIVPEELLASWVDMGYHAVPLVEEVGTFARRGGIIDVFPIGAEQPARIELFGRTIESLRSFDPISQRSLAPLASVEVRPITAIDRETITLLYEELAAIDISNLTPSAADRWHEDLARLEAGLLDDVQFFSPYLNGHTTLLDVAKRPLVVLDDVVEIRTLAAELVQQAAEFQHDLVERGELPAGLPSALLPTETLEARIRAARSIEFLSGGDEQAVEERVFERPPLFSGRVRDFLHMLRDGSTLPTSLLTREEPSPSPENEEPEAQHPRRSEAVIITSYQHARLTELLAGEGIGATVVDDLQTVPEPGTITIIPGSLAEGWIAPSLGISLYTDHEIFGWSKPRLTPRRRHTPREAFVPTLTPGDYVVHIEHGIGQFIGTTRMADDGVEREYLIVQYAGTDRLYVPTDQLDRLTRYVGMGDAKPQLSKLGGGEWARAKNRAAHAAQEMAEELIALYAKREAMGGHAYLPDTPWQRELEASFPYEETPDQLRAIEEVKADMEQPRVMDRLVVADVGYGKTEVAIRAAFKAVMDGKQVAILVPTTVLAQQHFETFRERLEAFPVCIEMLSRFRSPTEQREVLRRLATGEIDIVIGTHRLLSKDVTFKDLGLLVVDEEQRFGVRHKERLKQLRTSVDVLTLTATPIPRTLHMSLTGIRDVSIIQTPPQGRLPIKTYLQPYDDRLVREAIIRELERDGQVYFVHNHVASIEAVAEKLQRLVPEARIIVAHGQMPEEQLERVMLAFARHEADVLLCSTIIENGLDIANVNTILIDHAETLGLAQLYQLRGRVGRGVNQAYAYLLYPRDARLSPEAQRRLEAVFEATELGAGFNIAIADLEIRGAGNLLGPEQSGHVAAIGFDLYMNLLKEAIDRLRGQAVEERPQVTIELPFAVMIPADYVPDERERLVLYRRLAMLRTSEELTAFEAELRDRFGPLPPAVRNLLTQVEVKLLAERARISSLVLREVLVIRGGPHTLYDRVALYQRYGMHANIVGSTLRIPRKALGEDWLGAIRTILEETAALREQRLHAAAG
jgi:transcription-repair coupling factor (superfamily II helicase)